MVEQLNLLGDTAQPTDLALGPVQREVMRFLRAHGTCTRDEAGAIAHEHRDKHSRDELCAFCAIDGALVLESLIRRQLADPIPGGIRLPQPRAADGPSEWDDIPF